MTKVLIFDLETTGFLNTDRIVQIAWLLLEVQTNALQVLNEKSFDVKPDNFEIKPSEYHFCTHEKNCATGLPWSEIIRTFEADLIQADTIMSYNISFDYRFLTNECTLYNESGVLDRLKQKTKLCILQLCKSKLRKSTDAKLSYKLGKVFEFMFETSFQNHLALSDTYACAEIYSQIMFGKNLNLKTVTSWQSPVMRTSFSICSDDVKSKLLISHSSDSSTSDQTETNTVVQLLDTISAEEQKRLFKIPYGYVWKTFLEETSDVVKEDINVSIKALVEKRGLENSISKNILATYEKHGLNIDEFNESTVQKKREENKAVKQSKEKSKENNEVAEFKARIDDLNSIITTLKSQLESKTKYAEKLSIENQLLRTKLKEFDTAENQNLST